MKFTSYIVAVQLCVLLGSSAFYCQVTSLVEIVQLKEYFNASSSDVGDGGTLFFDILKNWGKESDKIIQSQIVSFYFKLFEQHKDNQTIKKSLETIKEEIIAKFFNSSYSKVEAFQNVLRISVNDLKVQRKAVKELSEVILCLSPGTRQRKRKRSQTLLRGRRTPQ
ncbi:interferon gamma [Nycticebus coucang]|uniref:interferon gamma n=1 Tax=Nycticebus coucang TaxID=9470 RepID=UPI00234D75DC|nr:interferon gamma [Nycticebus coucang]